MPPRLRDWRRGYPAQRAERSREAAGKRGWWNAGGGIYVVGLVASIFGFPNPVNEHAARVVAVGVFLMSVTTIVFDQPWILLVIVYGFIARVLTGPRLSPLGQLATKVVVPALGRTPKLVPGPPKRFAQAMGVVFSSTAVILHFGFGATTAAYVVLGLLITAAALEAFLAVCLGCMVFGQLMRIGVIPESVCAECQDIRRRVGV